MTYEPPDFDKPSVHDSPRTALLKFATACEALDTNLTQWNQVRAEIQAWADEHYPAPPPPPEVVAKFESMSAPRDVFGDGVLRQDYAFVHLLDNRTMIGEFGIWEVGRLGPFDGPVEEEIPKMRQNAAGRVWADMMLDRVEAWVKENWSEEDDGR